MFLGGIMSAFAVYSALFVPSSFVGVILLSWIQKFYLQGQPEGYIKGLPITLGVTVGLCVIVMIIAGRCLAPFDDILRKIERTGDEPTDEDRKIALDSIKKIKLVTIVFTVIGFVFGNLITMFISIAKGSIPLEGSRVIFAVIHSVSFGGLATFYTINLMDFFLAKKRALLKIRKIDGDSSSGKISSTIAYMVTINVLCVASTVAMVPFHLVRDGSVQLAENPFSFYLSHTLLVFGITEILCFVPIYMILHGLRTRLADNSAKIMDIAAKGDLVSRIDITVTDDFGLLTTAVNTLMEHLSEIIGGVRSETESVSNSAGILTDVVNSSVSALNQMSGSFTRILEEEDKQNGMILDVSRDIEGLKKGAGELMEFMVSQSSAMQENSASITEMAENIKSVANMTKKAEELSAVLSETSGQGNSLVTQAVNSITEIQHASQEVQSIIKVMQNIAYQTNLLSMNAAIEAAHAGDVGAGFAVVANEVRSLAASSSASAKDIQGHIKTMVEKIDGGVQAISQAGDAFRRIEACVQQNKELVQTLFSAMEEQRSGAEDNMRVTNSVSESLVKANMLAKQQSEFADKVRSAMDKVVGITEEVSSVIKEGEQAAQNLTDSVTMVAETASDNKVAVEKMTKHISVFKVD